MATTRQTLTMLAALAGAATVSQAPEYAQQYRQRMAGAIAELERMVVEFDADAARSGLDRQGALTLHDDAAEQLFRDRGASMRRAIDRYERLTGQSRRLAQSPALFRPVVVATGPDTALLAGTWKDFEPALPLTVHGLAWMAAGVGIGAVLARLLLLPFRRRRRRSVDEGVRTA